MNETENQKENFRQRCAVLQDENASEGFTVPMEETATKKRGNKKTRIALVIALSLVLLAVIALGGVSVYYRSAFLPGTIINGYDCSGVSEAGAAEFLLGTAKSHTAQLRDAQGDAVVALPLESFVDTDGFTAALEEYFDAQHAEAGLFGWMTKGERSLETDVYAVSDTAAASELLSRVLYDETPRQTPVDARIVLGEDGYTVDPNDTNNPKDYRFNSRDDMMGVSWYQSARLFRGNRLTVGADYYRFGGEAWNRYVGGDRKGERSDIADKSQDEVAGYVDFRQDIGGWLTFDAGLRVDHHSHIGTEWIPQAGLSFHLPHTIELKASASKGFRYPTIREMYMFPPQNPDLKPERMWNYEVAYSQRLLGGRLTYGINLFYIDGENLIVAVPREGTTPLNMNTGKIDNAGVEAQAAYRISEAWSVAANYSYLHMENPVIAAPEHKLYTEAGFARGRWSVTTGVQYVAGLYTSVKANGRGTENTEDFVLWNLRASLRVSRCLTLFARGENLLAQRYEINAGYPMPRATFIGGIRLDF